MSRVRSKANKFEFERGDNLIDRKKSGHLLSKIFVDNFSLQSVQKELDFYVRWFFRNNN